jgi:tetratricopeptide (TPR) repeat protein/CheY-like chemotaxis protein
MNGKLLFFIVKDDKAMRKIIADFLRQMVRGNEIQEDVEIYEAPNRERALELFEIMFKTNTETSVTYQQEPITPMPGRQGEALVICDAEMGLMGGCELLKICMDNTIFRDMNFVIMTEDPSLGLVSELGELGVMNILAKPLTFEKLSHTVRNLVARVQSDEHRHCKEVERLLDMGKYREALTLIKDAESKYTNQKWIILRGRAYLGLNETQRAKSDFELAARGAHIASIIALKHMVEVYEAAGDTKMTIDSLNKLILKSPNNVERRLKLSELFIEDGRPDEAKAVLDSLEMEQFIVAEIRTKVADLLEKAGFIKDAANMRLQMVDGKLDDFVFCNDVAIDLRKQGRYEAADDIYRKIIEAHSREATLWFNRAVNLLAWGKGENKDYLLREAMDHFRKASKLDPDLWEDADRAIKELKSVIKARMKECRM